MLHWLAGKPPPEGPGGNGATEQAEPPDTPAPVFAVRAFKHAIFGTPQTVQPKQRRNSHTDQARSRPQDIKGPRPKISRPKSAGDAGGLWEDGPQSAPDPASSPTKGILMTPGMTAAKRKTVSFGDHVMGNADKKLTKSGLPDDCPGKFPSPWSKPSASEAERRDPVERVRLANKLQESLEQARDESVKRKRKTSTQVAMKQEDSDSQEDDVLGGFAEPTSECGKYWKAQYDVYRSNTQREVRKLITKQKAAKNYAHEKDTQCTDLADQLRQEKIKVDRLENRSAELEMQLKHLHSRLEESEAVKTVPERFTVSNSEAAANLGVRMETLRSQHPPTLSQPSERSRPDPAQPVPAREAIVGEPATMNLDEAIKLVKPAVDHSDHSTVKARTRPGNARVKTGDDIWAQSLDSSSPLLSRSTGNIPTSPDRGRAVTSGTTATPLKSLSVNTLPTTNALTRHDSAQSPPPLEHLTKTSSSQQDETIPTKREPTQGDSSPWSLGLPQPSPWTQTVQERSEPQSTRYRATTASGANKPLPPQPKMQTSAGASLPATLPITGASTGMQISVPSNTQERGLGTAKRRAVQDENVKPSAAWSAINAPADGKRSTSLLDKSGKEVGVDRLEAARARIAARGRIVS